MPYHPLPRITLADAMADDNPLFVDTCPCGECQAYNASVGLPETPQTPIEQKPSVSKGARALTPALPTQQVDVLIERVVRKYGT